TAVTIGQGVTDIQRASLASPDVRLPTWRRSANQAEREGRNSMAGPSGAPTAASRLFAAFALFVAVCIHLAPGASAAAPPPSGGYFTGMQGLGSLPSLPSDSQAASVVHRSSWEPRPDNYTANHTVPPAGFVTLGYSGMQNHAQLFGRVTGNFTGTTDEIIQWAAAKWGLPDDIIRAV